MLPSMSLYVYFSSVISYRNTEGSEKQYVDGQDPFLSIDACQQTLKMSKPETWSQGFITAQSFAKEIEEANKVTTICCFMLAV